ncbi:MAG: N-acetyltransferase [Elainellaceae cyanobacterium]
MLPHDPPSLPSQDASLSLPQPLPSRWETSGHAVSPLLIRTVRYQDLASLAEVLASSFHSQEGTLGWLYPILRVGIYEDLRSRLQNRTKRHACLVAILRDSHSAALAGLSDRPIGTIEISLRRHSFNPFSDARYPYLSNLAVLAEYRRQGVAQELLQTCERVAKDWGFHEIYLHVLENNHRARRLYWKAGYRLRSIDTNPVGWLLGRPRQLLLRKSLL